MRLRLAVDPAVLAWALTRRGTGPRTALLQHDCFVAEEALVRLRGLMHELQAATRLPRGALWDLMEALVGEAHAVDVHRYREFLPLARRVADAPGCAPTLALALALEVDAVLAAGPGYARQDLVPVLDVAGGPRQTTLDGGGEPSAEPG